MRKPFFYVAVLLLPALTIFAQPKKQAGMQFEQGATWAQILAKAKKERKYIFMDAFTTWCGPCKMMANTIFPQEMVGQFYNANFINLKVQLDTTKKDNDEVKAWYKDAHKIMTQYKVAVFPTYLFFSPDGQLVHRQVGSMDANEFVQKGKDALDPEKQYYTLAARYKKGEKAPELLYSLSMAASNAYDQPAMALYSKEYIRSQKDLLTENNIKFLRQFTQNSSDTGFGIMLKNISAFDKVLGEGKTKAVLRTIVLQKELMPVIYKSAAEPSWPDLQAKANTMYPAIANEIIGQAKILYYYQQADWPVFSAAVSSFLQQFGSALSPNELNSYAWTIFESCNDMACVQQALEWSKASVDLTNEPMFIDTYANLLLKTGQQQKAIEWQEKAIALLKEKNSDTSEYESTLGKMKKGEKTWQ